jgi:hypothetical protein
VGFDKNSLISPHLCAWPGQDLNFQCHRSWSVLCSMSRGEGCFFALLILVELLTVIV